MEMESEQTVAKFWLYCSIARVNWKRAAVRAAATGILPSVAISASRGPFSLLLADIISFVTLVNVPLLCFHSKVILIFKTQW
jgi:hypothetical protein